VSRVYPPCPSCGAEPDRYSTKHDAVFCSACDRWTEDKCSDEACWYCAGRPEKPSSVVAARRESA
jgi:hypothetical protein